MSLPVRSIVRLTIAICAVLLAAPVLAKEESKIKAEFDAVGGSGARGEIRTQMSAGSARLHLKARGLEAGVEHTLRVGSTLHDDDGVELASFTPGNNGTENLKVDLDAVAFGLLVPGDADPRGRRVAVFDGTEDVLELFLLGDGAPLPRRLQLKERTSLLAGLANPESMGRVEATYQAHSNGKGMLLLMLRGVPDGEYEIFVNDVPVETGVVPNAAGNAQVRFRTASRGNGNGKGNNKKAMLDFDPFLDVIELRQGADVYFSGEMAAQVDAF